MMRIECPECGAGLKSPTGFAAGQTVSCPKCETSFTVEAPAYEEVDEEAAPSKKPVKAVASRVDVDDDDDEKPRKKKKKKSRDDEDDEEGGGKSYKNSPLRFIVLGVLVLIMIGLGIALYMKKMGEREEAKAPNEDAPATGQPGGGGNFPPGGGGNFPPGGGGNFQPPPFQGVAGPGIVNPKGGIVPKKGGIQPPPPPPPPLNNNPGGGDPIAGIFGESPRAGTADSVKLLETHRKKLLGLWEGKVDGSLHKISYQDNGQFTHEISGGGKDSTSAGTWNIGGLVGTRGVKINRGTVKLKAVFEGDELLHDTATPGETVVLKKK